MLLPVESRTGLGEFIITVARSRNAERHVRRVRSNLVGDTSLLDIVLLGKSEMFLGCDVTEHGGTVPRRSGCTNA